jgi:hypothetical protein
MSFTSYDEVFEGAGFEACLARSFGTEKDDEE